MSKPAVETTDMFGFEDRKNAKSVVSRRFLMPPFSVLDAKSGDWQKRKRLWKSLGIESEIGRDSKSYNIDGWFSENSKAESYNGSDGVSLFDPVLCELIVSWFCKENGQVVHPFAGGSVRGVV